MKNGWGKVALGEVLEPVSRPVRVEPDKSYRLLGIRLEGNGAFHRETKLGSDISTSSLDRVETGDFVYSRLFACRGAFSLISSELDGAFVSNEFPIFRVRSPARVDLKFLKYWFGQSRVWKMVEKDCQGSTPLTRNRYKEEFFNTLQVPLPSPAEQQQIVAHLEIIEHHLTRLREIRKEEQAEKVAFITSLAHRGDLSTAQKVSLGWKDTALSEILTLTEDIVSVDTTTSYPNIGIFSYGRGTFTKLPIHGSVTSAKQLFRVRAGQFIYSRLFAFEGAYAFVQPSQDGYYVSNEFPVFDLNADRIVPEFLFAYFKSPTVWTELAEQSTGLGNRRQRIHPEVILAHRVQLPPIEYQQHVSAVFRKVVNSENSRNDVEMKSMLHSVLDHIFSS